MLFINFYGRFFSGLDCFSCLFGVTVISVIIYHYRDIFIFFFTFTFVVVLDINLLLTWGIHTLVLRVNTSALI